MLGEKDGRRKTKIWSLFPFFLAQLPTVCDILAYVQLPRFAVATRKIGLALCMTRRPLGCGANFDMSNGLFNQIPEIRKTGNLWDDQLTQIMCFYAKV